VLTTRQFAARFDEFARRGVAIVKVFHSPPPALRASLLDPVRDDATGASSFPFDVLADSDREVYRRYGVTFTWRALLSPKALRRVLAAREAGLRPKWRDALRDGIGGCPADFLVGTDGRLERVHYGEHFADSVTPATALEWADAT
jgi:peroxiredoxin